MIGENRTSGHVRTARLKASGSMKREKVLFLPYRFEGIAMQLANLCWWREKVVVLIGREEERWREGSSGVRTVRASGSRHPRAAHALYAA